MQITLKMNCDVLNYAFAFAFALQFTVVFFSNIQIFQLLNYIIMYRKEENLHL